jgi:hypothetical protein
MNANRGLRTEKVDSGTPAGVLEHRFSCTSAPVNRDVGKLFGQVSLVQVKGLFWVSLISQLPSA